MRSPLPIFAMVALALMIVLGIVVFGASMASVNAETNQTAVNATLIPYEIQYGWATGLGLLALILALGFTFWYFWS